MHVPFNDLSRALSEDGADVMAAMQRVVSSGWFIMGPEMQSFERALATLVGATDVIGAANGTEALQLAIRAADGGRGGTVITTANSGGYATVAALAAGCTVRYCDVEPVHMTLDPTNLAECLDDDVTAVIVTHLYGFVADIAAVRSALEGRNIAVIEDCAQAIGGWNDQGRAGGLADLATFSFYPTKNLGALGDGGAVATSDPTLAGTLRQLRQYGWRSRYSVEMLGGMNSRLDEVQAAVLHCRIPRLADGNARRRQIIQEYGSAAPSLVRVLQANDGHAGHLCVVEVGSPRHLAEHLAQAGIQTAVHFPVPDYRQRAWRDDREIDRLPVTERMHTRILSLPCYPELTDDEVAYVRERLACYVG